MLLPSTVQANSLEKWRIRRLLTLVLYSHRPPRASPGRAGISFDAGVCSGYFFKIQKIAGKIEWGANNSCQTLNSSSVSPHSISSTLRRGFGPFNLGREDRGTVKSPTASQFSQVVTAYGDLTCKNTKSRVYDQVVNITGHGTHFGPRISPDSQLACEA